MLSTLNRELSWLSFNERVIQEAMDTSVPLVERIRFLGIYSNNLDEFFRVRVANIRRMMLINNNDIEGFDGTAAELFDEIRRVVVEQQRLFERTYKKILVDFSKHGVYHITEKDLNEEQVLELKTYFHDKVRHSIVPIILDKKHPFPRLRDYRIYLGVKMTYSDSKKFRYAVLSIPTDISRFHLLKEENKQKVILLDDILRLNLFDIFNIFNFETIEAYTFKFTRDAELDLDDDISISFFDKIEKSVKNRKKGAPVRFVYDKEMPADLLAYLLNGMNIKLGVNTIPGGTYHNFKDFRKFPDFGRPEFVYQALPPLPNMQLEQQRSIFKTILAKDVLLHFPYQRFSYIVDLLREVAIDPKVSSIKINVYRVSYNSQIMNALMNAVSNGKEVTVIFELQARFDEENNLYWSERLKEYGAKVFYGFPTMKVHSKLLQIKRLKDKKTEVISYIGTGNFHEQTAKVYGDLGLLTAHTAINKEVKKVFDIVEKGVNSTNFKELMVSPYNTRRKIFTLIQNEMNFAKKGKAALIQIKINNLVDMQLIKKLYSASRAGVKIELIVRGTCCLIHNLPKKSENIQVISIVDRFLEHARFMRFENNGDPQYYLSSADWMERNLDKRIEVSTPVYDRDIQKELDLIFNYQWRGNVKSRILDGEMKNEYRRSEFDEPFRAQFELYKYYESLTKGKPKKKKPTVI
ncbi:MAG: polyphosphate kinase 1 [Bacteroidetes bacterium]|nr:polyphosphate kinase 1 [Bacteroidota bacterium]